MARKPLSEKTVVDNVLKWRTGGINIDGCRVGTEVRNNGSSLRDIRGCGLDAQVSSNRERLKREDSIVEGRFPANIILDEEAGKVLDEQSGVSKSSSNKWEGDNNSDIYGKYKKGVRQSTFSDKGGASRFFYCPKVSKKERNLGCDDLEEKKKEFETTTRTNKETADKFGCERKGTAKNTHPTVKPVDLMSYLCRLITPPGGIVLDPFMGSGSTGMAAVGEGFRFCGMEMESEYFTIAEKRILWSETANS